MTTYTLNTEVGLLGIWDSKSLSFITTEDEYNKHFIHDKDILDLMNKGCGVFFGTGGDGLFDVQIVLNQNLDDDELPFVESKSLGNKLILSENRLILGSPESVGNSEKKALEEDYIKKIDIPAGTYLVDIFFIYNETNDMNTRFFINLIKVESSYLFEPKKKFPTLS